MTAAISMSYRLEPSTPFSPLTHQYSCALDPGRERTRPWLTDNLLQLHMLVKVSSQSSYRIDAIYFSLMHVSISVLFEPTVIQTASRLAGSVYIVIRSLVS